jgi:hypothetical protein
VPRANLTDDHPDRHTQSTHARFATHQLMLLRNAIKLDYAILLVEASCKAVFVAYKNKISGSRLAPVTSNSYPNQLRATK